MRPKKRVVTAADRLAGRRTPTVRKPRSAIIPATKPRVAPVPSDPDVVRTAAIRRDAAAADETGQTPDLAVDLGRGLVLGNPILVASGTFGYGVEYGEVVDVQRLGAICCKGTTLKARIGNRTPRVTETPAGMLNSIGLQNPGVDAVVEKYAAIWRGWRVPVVVNVAGESVGDYVEVVRRLDGVPGVAGIELNISCPNVGKGGLQFAIDAEAAGQVTAAVRRVTDLPLLGNVYGGVSGPAIKPIALRIVYEVAQIVDIPVVAIGGVTELADVLDYLAAGAVAVQVGTAIFADPALPVRLVDELAGECRRRGLATHRDLVGTALPPRATQPSAKGVEYRP